MKSTKNSLRFIKDAHEQNLELKQTEEKIRETTTFTDVAQYLSKGKNQMDVLMILAALATIVGVVIQIMNSQRPTKVEIVEPIIIEQLEEHNTDDKSIQPDPPTNNQPPTYPK